MSNMIALLLVVAVITGSFAFYLNTRKWRIQEEARRAEVSLRKHAAKMKEEMKKQLEACAWSLSRRVVITSTVDSYLDKKSRGLSRLVVNTVLIIVEYQTQSDEEELRFFVKDFCVNYARGHDFLVSIIFTELLAVEEVV